MSDYVIPDRDQIVIGRLRKKAAKLTKQRDHWKAEHDKLKATFDSFPIWRNSHERLQEARKREEEVKSIRARCKEQALLIEKLTAANPIPLPSTKP